MFRLYLVLLNVTFVITGLVPSRYKGDLRSTEYYDSGKIMFVENSNIFFSFMNIIYMNNLCDSRQSFKVMEWETSYSTFRITSAFKMPTPFSGDNCTGHQINIYFVCGTNQIHRYTLIQSNVLHFEELGMICSFWREEESTSKYQPNTWIQLNNLPYNKQTIHPGLIAASRLALFSHYVSSTDVKTGYSLVAANVQHEMAPDLIGPQIYAFGPKDQLSDAFKKSEKLQQNGCYYHNDITSKRKLAEQKNQFFDGWRSNSYSKLWFGENVQFLSISSVNSKYFYIIFTEQDISAPYTAYEGSLSNIGSTITRIGRVCQHDPGSKLSASVLPNGGGVFTTFRKTQLVCRAYSSESIHQEETNHYQSYDKFNGQGNTKKGYFNEQKITNEKSYLEFNRAIAVSEIVPTGDMTDHVFYALMTTIDSISGLYALCAFNLNSVDENLNTDHLIKLKQSNNAYNGLSRMVWRDNNNNNNNKTNSSSTHYSYYKHTSKWTVDVVSPSQMTKEIMRTSKTCPSKSLPDYYSQFATLHPLVGTSVWALNMINALDNQTTTTNKHITLMKQPGKALKVFTMNDLNNETIISKETPIDFTVHWANSVQDNNETDIIYIVTNKNTIYTIETGIKLKQQIVYNQNFKFELNSNRLSTINYFIKTNQNQKFQIMDQFTIIDNNYYIIQSIHKCDISSMLTMNMKFIHPIKKIKNSINANQFNEKLLLKQNKMIHFNPNKIICTTYFLCKNCQLTNKHFCKWNYDNHSCLLNDSSYSQLKLMDSNLYHFCNDHDHEVYVNQLKRYDLLRSFSNESNSNNNILSKKQITKVKYANDELNLVIIRESTPSVINTKTIKYNKHTNNRSHSHHNETDFNYKSLYNHIFNGILILSILIICIPFSMICGYLIGNKNYLKQYAVYNKVKRLLHQHHHQQQHQPNYYRTSSASSFSLFTFHNRYNPYIDLSNDQLEMFHSNCNIHHYHQNYCQCSQKRSQKSINGKNECTYGKNNKGDLMNSQYHCNNMNTTANNNNNNNETVKFLRNSLEKPNTTMHGCFYHHYYNDDQPNETSNEIISNEYSLTPNQQSSTRTTNNIHLYYTTDQHINSIDNCIKSRHIKVNPLIAVNVISENLPHNNRFIPNSTIISSLASTTCLSSLQTSTTTKTTPIAVTMNMFASTTTTTQFTSVSCCTPIQSSRLFQQQFQSSIGFKSPNNYLATNNNNNSDQYYYTYVTMKSSGTAIQHNNNNTFEICE
uniref:Sema domain-containing protein n=1 Tax=Schistosoma mansoni TaxID=6183 RepID=A0A5K4FBG1_SCHMA